MHALLFTMLSRVASITSDRKPHPTLGLPSSFGFHNTLGNGGLRLHTLLIQAPPTPEAFAAAAATRHHQLPVKTVQAFPHELAQHGAALRSGGCLPVGTPAFIRLAIQLARLPEPDWNTWPSRLDAYMLTQPRRITASGALRLGRPVLVRPLGTDAFKPFVLRPRRGAMGQEDLQQLRQLERQAPTEPVLVTEALDLAAEWRYYVLLGEVVGAAPCAVGAGAAAALPDLEDVSAIVAAVPNNTACAVDVGVLHGGGTTLLRVHDPLRTEFIPVGPDHPTQLAFLRMLWTRWQELVREAARPT